MIFATLAITITTSGFDDAAGERECEQQ